MDRLHVVQGLKCVDELQHLLGQGGIADGHRDAGDIGQLGRLRLDRFLLQGLGDGVESRDRREHLEVVAVVHDIVGASLKDELHKGVLANLGSANEELALLLEAVGHGAGLGHVAAVIVKGLTDFGRGAVLIVRGDFDDESDSARGVAFVDNLFVDDAGDFAGALLHRALDIIRRHVGRTGLVH